MTRGLSSDRPTVRPSAQSPGPPDVPPLGVLIRGALGFLALTAAFFLGTWIAWWMVPVIAALWGALLPSVRAPMRNAAVAATLGWLAWLVVDALKNHEAFYRVDHLVAHTLSVPPSALFLVTLAVPALLAWSASAVACRIAGVVASSGEDS